MAGKENSKEKLLYILEILKRQSDEEHLFSVQEIINELVKYNIEAERKSIYRDLAVLKDFGVEKKGRKYFYDSRMFEDIEFMILIEAIASLKALPPKKSKQIIEKLKELMGTHKAKELAEGILVDETLKIGNDKLYYTLDTINQAIRNRKKIAFHYGKEGNLKTWFNGRVKQYILNPYKIVLVDQIYYLIGNYDYYNDLSHYRIDKIQNIELREQDKMKPLKNTTYKKSELDTTQYIRNNFGMFPGEISKVVLECRWEVEDILYDKFGKNFLIGEKDNITFRAYIECIIGDAFVRWLIAFADQIKVIGPQVLVEEVKERIKRITDL